MANKAQQQLQLVLQPLVDGEIDDEILSYIAEAAVESPDDVSGDMLKGLLPQLEQYSETTLASVVASLLHQVTAVPKPSASACGHVGATAALAASRARTGAAPTPSSEPGWTTSTKHAKALSRIVSSKSASSAPLATRAVDMASASPQLQALAAMFPDIAPTLLMRLLNQSAHNVETAVDTLLGQEDLPAYVARLGAAEERAQAKAQAAAEARTHATAAATARVLQRFHEHDVKSSVAAPDIIKMDGRYVQIRAQRGAPAASKKMLKKARTIASRKAASTT